MKEQSVRAETNTSYETLFSFHLQTHPAAIVSIGVLKAQHKAVFFQ